MLTSITNAISGERFVLSQDVFKFRRDGTSLTELAPHPKLLSFPLGVHWRDHKEWKQHGPMFSFALKMLLRQFHDRYQFKSDGSETTRTDIAREGGGQKRSSLLQRPRLIVSRNGETLQRVAMAQQIKLVLGTDADVGYNKGGGREEYVRCLLCAHSGVD